MIETLIGGERDPYRLANLASEKILPKRRGVRATPWPDRGDDMAHTGSPAVTR